MSNRYCPYCGERLQLAMPQLEYFPETVGVSLNGVTFCVINPKRRVAYTKQPRGFDYNTERKRKSLCNSNLITYRSLRQDKNTGPYMAELIRKGGAALYFNKNFWYMCGRCKNKVALDRNPFRGGLIFAGIAVALFLTDLVLSVINENHQSVLWIAVVLMFLAFELGCCAVIKQIEKHSNNWVPVDENDDLVTFDSDFEALVADADKKYLHLGNVLCAQADGREYRLYVTERRGDALNFAVCGTDGESGDFIAAAEKIMQSGGDAILELRFGAASVGSVKITRIFKDN